MRDFGRGNCTAIENLSILNCSSAVKRINVTTSGHVSNEDQETDDEESEIAILYSNFTDFSMQVISHIAGNIVHVLMKKIHCDTCIGALLANKTNVLHKFIIAKNKGGLLFPSEDVIHICKVAESDIRAMTDNQLKLKKEVLVSKMLRNFVGSKLFEDINFHQVSEYPTSNHVTDLIKAATEKYINVRLHFLLKNTNIKLPNKKTTLK